MKLNGEVNQLQGLIHLEKFSPDILPYSGVLVQYILKKIREQTEEVNQTTTDPDQRLRHNLMSMEMERVKFMLKSYLRARLVKIERHLIFVIEKDQSALLSDSEMEFAWKLFNNKRDVFHNEFFVKLPSKMAILEEDSIDNRLGK